MAEVSAGKFGFVILVQRGEAGEVRTEVECFVAERDERWSVIVTPAFPSEVGVSDSSWDKGTACAAASCEASPVPDEPLMDIAGYEKSFVLRKVESSTVRMLPQTKDVALRFEPRPQAVMLLEAYSTRRTPSPDKVGHRVNIEKGDIEAVAQKMLEAENQRLLNEMTAMKNALGKSMRSKSPDRRRQEPHIGPVTNDGVEEEDEVESGSNSDGGDATRPDNALLRRLNSLAYHTAEETPGGVGGGGFGGRGEGSKTTERRRRQSPDGEDRDEQPAEHNRTGRRMSPRRPRRGGNSRKQSDTALVLMEMQKEMLMLIKDMRSTPVERGLDKDDAPAGSELDGLRVMRNLGRMRALKEDLELRPERTYREYRAHWIQELGAEGRAFRWTDSHLKVRWKKYASIRRVDWMLCHLLETLETDNLELAKARTIQCMKALREFPNHGSWKAAWPLTHLVDPLKRYAHGGLEVETEVVMGWLRTQDDLEAKVLKSTKHQVSGDERDEGDEDADKPDKAGKGGGKGPTKKKDEKA